MVLARIRALNPAWSEDLVAPGYAAIEHDLLEPASISDS